MHEVLGDILPLAVAAGLSPIPLIAVVLLVLSPRPGATGSAFAAGWMIGCTVIVTIGATAAGLLRTADPEGSGAVWGWLRIALGLFLLLLAVRKFRRHRESTGELPAWMSSLMKASTARSLWLGIALSALNPKNIVLGFAAGLSIGSAGLPRDITFVTAAIYVVIASVAVLAVVLSAVVAPRRMAGVLARARDWLTRHHSAIVSVLFVVFGFVLIGKGIEGL